MISVATEYTKYQKQSVTELVARHALGDDYCGQTSSATYSDLKTKFAQLSLPNGALILDAGCGNGCFALKLIHEFGCQILGVDISEELIKEANQSAAQEKLTEKASFKVIDFTTLTAISDQTFHLIMSIGSLYWNPNIEETLSVWSKKILPNGHLLIYSNLQVEELNEQEAALIGNTKFISFKTFVGSLEKHSFKVEQVLDQTPEYVLWIRRWCEGLEIHKDSMKEKMGGEGFANFADRFKVYKQLAESAKVKRMVLIARNSL